MDSKIIRLVKLLHRKTMQGELRWEPTAADDVFQYTFPDYTVQLSERGQDYIVTLHDDEGVQIERVTDVTLKEEGYVSAYEDMRELYETARREAMGVNEALDRLIKYLGDDESAI